MSSLFREDELTRQLSRGLIGPLSGAQFAPGLRLNTTSDLRTQRFENTLGPRLNTASARYAYRQQLIQRGLSPSAAAAAVETLSVKQEQGIERPESFLDKVFGVIGFLGEQVESRFSSAIAAEHEYAKREDESQWSLGAFLAGARGFFNPSSKYGWEEALEASTAGTIDADSTAANIISLGMSVVTDPLTYVTFGATSTSRQAASRMLAHSWQASRHEADRLIAETNGINPVTGAKFKDIDEAIYQIHKQANRPMTLGDALTDLRVEGLAMRDAVSRGKTTYVSPLTSSETEVGRIFNAYTGEIQGFDKIPFRKRIMANLAPYNVQGGRGVRFMGMEVPGTPALGQALATKTREVFERNLKDPNVFPGTAGSNELLRAAASAGVPRWKAKMIVGDARRALVLNELAQMRYAVERASLESQDVVVSLSRADDIQLMEPDIVPLYRGDKSRVSRFQMNKTDPMALYGQGIYLTTSEKVGESYILKGADDLWSMSDEEVEWGATRLDDKRHPVTKEEAIRNLERDMGRADEFDPDTLVGQLIRGRGDQQFMGAKTYADLEQMGYELWHNEAGGEWVLRAKNKGKLTEMRVPRAMLDNIIDVSAPLADEVKESVAKGLRSFQKKLNKPLTVTIPGLTDQRMLDPEELKSLIDEFLSTDFNQGSSWNDIWRSLRRRDLGVGMSLSDIPELQKSLRDTLKRDHGIIGLKYAGGGLMGNIAHDAYSIWDVSAVNQIVQNKHPMQQAYENVLEGQGELIPLGERAGALQGAPRTTRAKALAEKIDRLKRDIVREAVDVGVRDKELDDLWQRMVARYPDPVQAMAEFKFRASTEMLKQTFIFRILENPLFSRRYLEEAKEEVGLNTVVGSVPDGWMTFSHQGKKFVVREDVFDALDEFLNPAFIDQELDRFLRIINTPQNWWKLYATQPNPSFHLMNFLGAVWNNMFAFVYNPADYVGAMALRYKASLETSADLGKKRRRVTQPASLLRGAVPESTAEGRQAQEMFREFQVRGATGRGASIYTELGLDRLQMDELTGEVPSTWKEKFERLTTGDPHRSKKRRAATALRRGAGIAGVATLNPLAAAAFAPEIARTMSKFGTAMEDVVRLAPFVKHSQDPVVRQVLHAYGPITVPGARHNGWSKVDQATMYDIGAEISKHFQFDYTDLTTFERRFAKTIFPFYTFYRKNFVLQMQQLVQRPRQIETFRQLQGFIEEEGTPEPPQFREILPEYFSNIDAFRVPIPAGVRKKLGLPVNEPIYINPKLPFVSLNLFPPLWELVNHEGYTTAQTMGNVLAPVFGSIGPMSVIPGAKPMFEAWIGTQLGLNQPIDYQRAVSNDWRNSIVPAPSWVKHLPEPIRNFWGVFPWGPDFTEITRADGGRDFYMTATSQYVLEQMATPFITNLGKAIPVGGPGYEGQKATSDMVSWLTGVRLIPVDPLRLHRQWGYRMINMLESARTEARDAQQPFDPQDQIALSKLRAMVRVLEFSWDQRQAEIYGGS